jgi:hypothetical protein
MYDNVILFMSLFPFQLLAGQLHRNGTIIRRKLLRHIFPLDDNLP